MTSIKRQIQRRNPNYEAPHREQLMEDLPDGGYRTLHPTNGWKYVSGRRAEVRNKMALMYGFVR